MTSIFVIGIFIAIIFSMYTLNSNNRKKAIQDKKVHLLKKEKALERKSSF